jgi:hypothetical protein
MPDELIATYADPGAALGAVQALRARGVSDIHLSSPAGFPVVDAVDHRGDSQAQGWIAFCGGLVGLSTAIWLQVATSKSLGLIVGGKPIVAWTAFGVIMFELTMLFAGGANLTALIVLATLARRKMSRAAREQLSADRILVVVPLGGLAPQLREAVRETLGNAVVGAAP